MRPPFPAELLGRITPEQRKRIETATELLWRECLAVAGEVADPPKSRDWCAAHAILSGQAMRLLIHNMERDNEVGLGVLFLMFNDPDRMSAIHARVTTRLRELGIEL